MLMPNEFDSNLHQIVEVSQVSYLRRELGLSDLFMVRNLIEGNWSICIWVSRARGVFAELLALRTLQSLTQAHVQSLRQWANGYTPTVREAFEAWRSARRNEERQLKEEEDEARENMRFLGRRFRRLHGNMVTEKHNWDLPAFPTSLRQG